MVFKDNKPVYFTTSVVKGDIEIVIGSKTYYGHYCTQERAELGLKLILNNQSQFSEEIFDNYYQCYQQVLDMEADGMFMIALAPFESWIDYIQ